MLRPPRARTDSELRKVMGPTCNTTSAVLHGPRAKGPDSDGVLIRAAPLRQTPGAGEVAAALVAEVDARAGHPGPDGQQARQVIEGGRGPTQPRRSRRRCRGVAMTQTAGGLAGQMERWPRGPESVVAVRRPPGRHRSSNLNPDARTQSAPTGHDARERPDSTPHVYALEAGKPGPVGRPGPESARAVRSTRTDSDRHLL